MGNSHPSNASKKDTRVQESMPKNIDALRIVESAFWEWKSNQDPWATDESPQWTQYSTEQILIIEKAFQEKKETVEIGDYVVNFKSLFQVHKEQNWRTRPIRRTEMSQRATRFCSELITPRTFGRVTYTGDPTIVEKWVDKRKFNFKIDKQGYNMTDVKDMPQLEEVVALAIKGLLEEGKKENLGSFIERLAKRLEDSISQSPKLIFRECIYIYTDENKGASSLYTIVNKALREVDYSKVETLGPYCYLLNFALKALSDKTAEFFSSGKVYRGLGLEENMFEMYKTAWKRGLQISFHSFVSTSKRREVASAFSVFRKEQQKILLIIETLGGAYVEALTSHHGEEEVLLPASRGFQITDIDETNPEMPIISLKMINTNLDSLHFEDDFSYGILLSHSSFTELPPSLSQWAKDRKVNFEISEDGKNITPENESLELKKFVELAAEGIRKFGETQTDEEQREKGEEMAEMLDYTMKNEPSHIFRTVIKLYTMRSFLYLHANKILRSESSEKLNYLGPYCYLLNAYLIAINKILSESSKSKKQKFETLYRGTLCTPAQMNVFKELYAKNLHFAFSSFTSTTTERYIAEHFRKYNGNQSVLYIISVPESMASAFNIADVSVDETLKEVVLPPNLSFKITGIDLKTFEIKLEFIDYMI